jgi:predicted benzoate:H+ symporter BenE
MAGMSEHDDDDRRWQTAVLAMAKVIAAGFAALLLAYLAWFAYVMLIPWES